MLPQNPSRIAKTHPLRFLVSYHCSFFMHGFFVSLVTVVVTIVAVSVAVFG